MIDLQVFLIRRLKLILSPTGGIIEDNAKNLWLESTSGIIKLNPDNQRDIHLWQQVWNKSKLVLNYH